VNADLMQSLLAGWVSGAAAGLATTMLVLVWLARSPERARRLPMQVRLPILGIVVVNAMVITLTLVGLVAGALHHNTRPADGSAGLFPVTLAAIVLASAALYAFVRGRIRSAEAPLVLGSLLVFGLAFGGMLPWLAGIEV